MSAVRKFLVPSPRDFKMQTMTVAEIADAMAPVDHSSLSLPSEFAHRVRRVLESEGASAPASSHKVSPS